MPETTFRNATINDLPFLIDTIIEAEKSGTNILTYNTIFGLSEDETRKYLGEMLLEEIDGCELSVSSFLIAEIDNIIAGAVSAWIENAEGLPSSVLKGNLLGYILPGKALEKASGLASIIHDINIECIPNTIQIGLVYVAKDFRGRNLAGQLIEKKIELLLQHKTKPTDIYIQVFSNNLPAIKAYEKLGFRKTCTRISKHENVPELLPSDCKILLKREL